jgi:plastocyanin
MRQRRGVLIGMVLVLCFLAACGRDDTPKEHAPTASSPATQQAAPSPGSSPRVIEVTEAFIAPHFRPNPLVLKVGEPVQFKVTSADTRHTFIIEALGIDVEVPQKSLNETVTTKVVTPQAAGTFRVFCRIHERLPMEGSIEVTATGAAGQ